MTTVKQVITIVITMETTIVKIGNSLGSRYSKAYLDKLGLKEGDKVEVILKKKPKPDKVKAIAALRAIAEAGGSLTQIKDPVAWQREQRKWTNPWDEVERDIARQQSGNLRSKKSV